MGLIMSKFSDIIAGAGAIIASIGGLGMIAMFPAWAEIGEWTSVLTWFAAGSAGLLSFGATLVCIGGRLAKNV